MEQLRVGEGWDRHRLVPGESLVLAGVPLESDTGTEGFSDGDAFFHAAIDALLGAAGMGDVGTYYPSGEEAWKNADSGDLLEDTVGRVRAAGWSINNLDGTLMIESVRLEEYRDRMLASLRGHLGENRPVNLKFKTADGLGPVGRGEAVEARVIVLLRRS